MRAGSSALVVYGTLLLALGARPCLAAAPALVVPSEAPRVAQATTLKTGKTALRISPNGDASENLTVLKGAPAGWSDQAAPDVQVKAGAPQIVLSPNEQVIVKPKPGTIAATEVMQLSANKTALPGVLLSTSTSVSGVESRVRTLRLFLQARQLPLRWADSAKAYALTLLIGLDEESNALDSAPLASPVAIEITGRNLDVIQPARVLIERAGTSGYREVRLTTERHDQPVEVLAHSDLGDLRFTADIDPGLKLVLESSQDRVLGFGLESVTLTITRLAHDGRPLLQPAGGWVTMTATQGSLSTSRMRIPERESDVSASLLSTGSGTVMVSARLPPAAGQVKLDFVVPWLHFIALIVGALIGGALRMSYTERSLKEWKRSLLGALAVGVVAVCAVLAGLPISILPPLVVRTELGWFVLGALSAFVGVELVARLAELVFKTAPSRSDPR